MAYVMLGAAIAVEVVATLLLKVSDGFAKPWPSAGTAIGYALAFVLLARALKQMEVGFVYAVWSGAGTAVITLLGIAILGESVTALKIGGTALIVLGVVALNLSGSH